MTMNDILPELMPLVISGLGVILSGLIGAAAHTAKRRWGLEIEARHREALHSALMSGIRAAIERGPEEAAEVLIEEAIEHARQSVPDAISLLGPSAAVLNQLARGKLLEAVGRFGG